MTVNKKIQIGDYNDIRNKVIGVLGPGAGNFGYGQRIQSTAVTERSSVTVNEWTNLYYDIANCYNHITGALPPSAATAVVNATIRSNPTNSVYTQYDTFADYITTNRFAVAQSITTAKGTASRTWPDATLGPIWNVGCVALVTVTFNSATSARYFFNSGGTIRFSSSRSGGTAFPNSGYQQNQAWTNLLSSVGIVSFGGNAPGVGIDPNDCTNYYRLKNTFSPWYSLAASSPYTSNVFRIQARSPDVADNSSGTASRIEFEIDWLDGYVDPGPAVAENLAPGDQVDGTLSYSVSTLEASGVLVPAGAGTFSVESPTVVLSGVSSSNSPIYNFSGSVNSVNEGGTVTFNASGFFIPNGTYSYEITGMQAADFTDNALTGTFTITNSSGSFTKTLSNDLITEGVQFINCNLKSGATVLAASQAIQVNDTSTEPVFTFSPTLSGDSILTYDIRANAVASGWNQTDILNATLTINSGARLVGPNLADPVITTGSTFPARSTITIINSGLLAGAGGTGGGGANNAAIGGGAGSAGGPALVVNYPTTVYNYGQIFGGGGGGGGGGWVQGTGGRFGTRSVAGGGGGGGFAFGSGGPGNGNGGNGNFDFPGLGGGNGGAVGGSFGSAGGNGTSFTTAGGGGGGAGIAVDGDAYITWAVLGAVGTRT
jgi:hypothetical protein